MTFLRLTTDNGFWNSRERICFCTRMHWLPINEKGKKTFSRLYDKTRCPYFGVNRYDCTEQEKDDHKYKQKVFFTTDKVLVFT